MRTTTGEPRAKPKGHDQIDFPFQLKILFLFQTQNKKVVEDFENDDMLSILKKENNVHTNLEKLLKENDEMQKQVQCRHVVI